MFEYLEECISSFINHHTQKGREVLSCLAVLKIRQCHSETYFAFSLPKRRVKKWDQTLRVAPSMEVWSVLFHSSLLVMAVRHRTGLGKTTVAAGIIVYTARRATW